MWGGVEVLWDDKTANLRKVAESSGKNSFVLPVSYLCVHMPVKVVAIVSGKEKEKYKSLRFTVIRIYRRKV